MSGKLDTTSVNDDRQHALWLPIPPRAISAVEHPCVVKNVDKGITSLGGPTKLSKRLRSQLESTTNANGDDELKKLISVSLRPTDPFAKRLLSTPVRTNNLLLKVTVPKRTGRRRKRASLGSFLPGNDLEASASSIYRSLYDNAATYKVTIAGIVDEIHRFRNMPDLQYSAASNDIMTELRDHVLAAQYSRLKNYRIHTGAGANVTKNVGPSAEFLQMPVAFNYKFQQNAYVKYTERGVVNLQKSIAYNAYTIIKPTEEVIPTGPAANLPPEGSLAQHLQALVHQIRELLKMRPIITRHLLYNKLGWDKRTKLRQAAVYCGYFFESGPWREALICWGVDPRKDPEYRKYQTISFLSYLKISHPEHHKEYDQHVLQLSRLSAEELKMEHTFDGKNVSKTGNLFQFCDITDPLIAKILATKDIRRTCAPTFQGWYHVGTWAKATVILKDKMNTIVGKKKPDEAIYQRVVKWPELWDDQAISATYKAEVMDRQIREEKKKEHSVMHQVRWAARNPRYAFEKMEAANEQEHETEAAVILEDCAIAEDMAEKPVTVDEILDDESDRHENDSQESDGEESNEDDVNGTWDMKDVSGNVNEPPDTDLHHHIPFGGLFKI